ncbi:MAG: hypothetical protein LC104_07660 [Bacteroidales bacterium]|nr:hypothetical protein [Bacteroidales bacterium]
MAKPVAAAKVKGLFPTTAPSPATLSPAPTPEPAPEPPPLPERGIRVGRRGILLVWGSLAGLTMLAVVVGMAVGSARKGGRATAAGQGSAAVGEGAIGGEDGVDLPDFSRVDYSLDTSNLNYEKGPNGEKLVLMQRATDDGPELLSGYTEAGGRFVQHGLLVGKHLTGERRCEEEFYAGQPHGKTTLWYTNGQVVQQGQMKDGKEHGVWTKYREDGSKWLAVHFLGGERHGTETEWFPTGQKKEETTWVAGKRHGVMARYDERGGEVFRIRWREGEPSYRPSGGTRESFRNVVRYLQPKFVHKLDRCLRAYGTPDAGLDRNSLPPEGRKAKQRWVYSCRDGAVEMEVQVQGVVEWVRDGAGSAQKLIHYVGVEGMSSK